MTSKKRTVCALAAALALCFSSSGCLLAVGAGGVGAGYEYSNKQKLDRLEKEYKTGKISKEEYLKRKKQIKEGSVVY